METKPTLNDQAVARLIPGLSIFVGPVCLVDVNECVRYANKDFFQLLGAGSNIIGQSLREVYGDNYYSLIRGAIRRCLVGEPSTQDRPPNKGLKQTGWLRVQFSPVFDESDTAITVGFVMTYTDIGSLKDREISAADRERRLKHATEAVGIPICYFDSNQRVVMANGAICRSWLKTEAEVLGTPIRECIGEENYAVVQSYIESALQGESVGFERSVDYPGIGQRRVRTIMMPETLPNGRVVGAFTVGFDIEEDFQLKEALVARERQLKNFTDNVPEAIAYIDVDRRFRFVNEAYCKYRGLPREKIIGRSVSELFSPAQVALLAPHYEKVRRGETSHYDRLVTLPDNSQRWLRVSMIPDMCDDGIRGHYVVGTDIHDIKLAGERQIQQEIELREFADNIPQAIAFVNADWQYEFANNVFLDSNNVTISETIGRTPTAVVGEEVGNLISQLLPALKRAETQQIERLARIKDGLRWVRTRFVPRFNADGAYLGYYDATVDIHDLIIAQRESLNTANEFKRFTDNIPEPIAYVNKDWRYTYANAEFLRLMGKRSEEVIGNTPAEVLGPELSEHIRPFVERASLGDTVEYERRALKTVGEEVWLNIRLVPIKNKANHYDGHYVIGRDITEIRQARISRKERDDEIQRIFDRIPVPMAYLDENLVYRIVNQAYLKWADRKSEDVIRRSAHDILNPRTIESAMPFFARALKGESLVTDRELWCPDGTLRWHRVHYSPQFDSSGTVIGFYFASYDIHDRKLADEALNRANLFLESHLALSPMAIVECSRDFLITRWSPQAERNLGWRGREALGSNALELGIFGDVNADIAQTLFLDPAKGNEAKSRKVKVKNKKGDIRWYEWHHSVLRDQTSEVISILSLGQDITERVQTEEKLLFLAAHDVLTGLPNRRMFTERILEAFNRAKRTDGQFAVLFIDLDGFKEVNDQYGHSIGDAVLIEVAKRIKSCLREIDMLARISGDEFTIVMEGFSTLDAIQGLANRILTRLRGIKTVVGVEISISASIGASTFPQDGASATELLKHADAAMYEAKGAGKNQFRIFAADTKPVIPFSNQK